MSGLGEHERETIRDVLGRLDHDVSLLLELGPEETPTTMIAGGREIDFVPAIVANGRLAWVGAVPEAAFAERLLLAAGTARLTI